MILEFLYTTDTVVMLCWNLSVYHVKLGSFSLPCIAPITELSGSAFVYSDVQVSCIALLEPAWRSSMALRNADASVALFTIQRPCALHAERQSKVGGIHVRLHLLQHVQ